MEQVILAGLVSGEARAVNNDFILIFLIEADAIHL